MLSSRTISPVFPVFILCAAFGIVLLHPYLDHQDLLAQGDHGRDLYCFKKTFEGAAPYKDYWWEYGPLMPYYYSLFFKAFGVSIQSVLLGQCILVLLCGTFLYLTAALVMSPWLALAAAMFFWVFRPDPFYTYNHIGATFLQIFILFCLLRQRISSNNMFFYFGLFGVFLLDLVRVNIGIACLSAFLAGLACDDHFKNAPQRQKKLFIYAAAFFFTGLATAGAYFYFTRGVAPAALKQCFPYFSSYRPDTAPPLKALVFFWKIVAMNFTATWQRRIFGLIVLSASVRAGFLLIKNKLAQREKADTLTVLLCLLVFLLFNVHEFLFSASVFRISWFFPFGLLLFFVLIDRGLKGLPVFVRGAVPTVLLVIAVLGGLTKYQAAQSFRKDANLFQYGQSRVFVNNNSVPGQAKNQWVKTVTDAADFLRRTTKDGPGKPVLALPYDALYYFLSGKDSAVYPLAFFKYLHITPQEEKAMIGRLEEQKVDVVLLSNRSISSDPELGVFGVDYCPLLAEYIRENFGETAAFGDWQSLPGFTANHAVKILRRKPPHR